jgi:hypothetical protein
VCVGGSQPSELGSLLGSSNSVSLRTPCPKPAPEWFFMAFLDHLGLNIVRKPHEITKNPLNAGLANEPARTLAVPRSWCRWPAFTSGAMPGLVLVPVDAGRCPLRSPAKKQPGHQPLSPSGSGCRFSV